MKIESKLKRVERVVKQLWEDRQSRQKPGEFSGFRIRCIRQDIPDLTRAMRQMGIPHPPMSLRVREIIGDLMTEEEMAGFGDWQNDPMLRKSYEITQVDDQYYRGEIDYETWNRLSEKLMEEQLEMLRQDTERRRRERGEG